MTDPFLVTDHKLQLTQMSPFDCVVCKHPANWHKSFGEYFEAVFNSGTWRDYLAKELQDGEPHTGNK